MKRIEPRSRPLWTAAIVALSSALALQVAACGPDRSGGRGGGGISADNNGSRWNNGTLRPEERIAPEEECGDFLESGALQLLNDEREQAGLNRLLCDLDMLQVAREHSSDMVARGFFDHVNPDGEQPWDRMERNGVSGWFTVGENIAAGQRTAAEVHDSWMNSAGHRANILNDGYTHAAVGIHNDGEMILWTQVFATF